MHILGTVLSIFFIIICVLLILLILLQSGRSSGMSLFGGSASQTAFGANSGDVLTKTTAILVALFMITGLGMAFIKRQDSNLKKIQEKISENPDAEEEKTDAPADQMETTPGATPEANQAPVETATDKK